MLTDVREHFRAAVRNFAREVTPDLIRERDRGRRPPLELLAAIARNDWFSVGIPEEFGGIPDYVCLVLLIKELAYGYLPLGDLAYRVLILGAGVLINHGTDAMRRDLLPRLSRGELLFLNGITEPSTGADASGLTTRAAGDGEHWVINGHKTFNIGMGFSDFVLCCGCTDPDAPRHKGISAILVPAHAEGLTFREIGTIGLRTTPTYEAWY